MWRESEADKLRKELEEKERLLTASKCETMKVNIALSEEKKAREELERKNRRVHNGVCPCCNRTFNNLQRHMKAKHPTFKANP